MNKLALSLATLVAMLALLPGTPAQAQPTKVWVSNAGADSGTCGAVTTPCATFQQAHDNVAAGGEIGVLTPGDYGLVNIIKSVSITNDGTGEATILATSAQTAVFINAGTGDIVSLRGLVIDGQGSARSGIVIHRASAVHVQNCVIRNFEASGQGYGILATSPSNTRLFVSDTIIFNNGSSAGTGGIVVTPVGTASAEAVIDRVHLENNVDGLLISGSGASEPVTAVVRESVISGNAANGIHAVTFSGTGPAFVFLDRSSVVNNAASGILADGQRATVLLGGSQLTRNGAGVTTVNGGKLFSYGDNQNNNNVGPEGTATGTFTPF